MDHPSATTGELATAAWEALGTSVVLRVTAAGALARARAAVEGELAAVDRACSRFRSDSELSRVNARTGRAVSVDPLLIEAIGVALRAAALTDGDVDPTLGRALELAGYDRDWKLLQPSRGEPRPTAAVTVHVRAGWRAVELDRSRATVRVPSGVKLDLGATAKAWAADRAAAAAALAGGCGALVSLGGDIATAGEPPREGWQIHVTDDHRSGASAPGQRISIRSGGLATSSTAVRRWSHEGHTMHHIIDPATGAPAETRWKTVSVAAASCTDANIATTAALVRGADAPGWLAGLGLPARLLDWREELTIVAGWPEQEPGGGHAPARAPAPLGSGALRSDERALAA
jgi:thiamine biosynthesis lipoprotein ApbE